MKICIKCGEEKELIEFSKNRQSQGGFTNSCIQCNNQKSRDWYKNNKERGKNTRKIWSDKNKERRAITNRNSELVRKYNITENEYQQKYIEQNGKCCICNNFESIKNRNGVIKKLAVDHCHKTGIIRGLLCHYCNLMLGYVKDNTDVLEYAIAYIKQYE